MRQDVLMKACDHIAYYRSRGLQHEVSITGLGEALMHPQFKLFAQNIRRAAGSDCYINFSTNGILFDEDIAQFCREENIKVYVSLHRPERATPAINIAKHYGVLADTNISFATSSFNWAGEIEWAVTAAPIVCQYLLGGWGVILADGRVSTCCIDAHGQNIIGSVWDELGSLATKPFPLCDGCHMQVPEILRCREKDSGKVVSQTVR